jgi:hypothetical protein
VTLTAGQVLTGVDFALTPAARIVPTYLNSDGSPNPNAFAPSASCTPPAVPVRIDGVSGPTMGCDVGDPAPGGNYGTYILIPTGPVNFGVLNSGTIALDLRADEVVDCTIVFGGTISCVPGTQPAPDDGDGVPATVEDAAPNSGDGNLDGVADSVQSNVASLPVAVGTGYLTASVAVPNLIEGINVNPTFGDPSASDVGRIAAFVVPAHYGDTIDIVLRKESPWNANSLLSGFLGRPEDRLPDALVAFNGSTVVLHITDGGVGDDDHARTGSIQIVVTPVVGPATPVDTTPPNVECPNAPTFLLNEPGAALSAIVTDTESGVASPTATVTVSTSHVGANTVAVSASDLAGNVAEAQCAYSVGVRLDRLISPSTREISVAKAGRFIAVRWRALDYTGAPVTDPSHFVGVAITASSCGRGHSEHIDSVRNRGLRYLGNGRWEYDVNVPTSKGCSTLRLDVAGASRSAQLRIN